MGLARHDGEDGGHFRLGGAGGVGLVRFGMEFCDARGGVGGGGEGEFEGLGGGFNVDEGGESGVEELGEDVGEWRGVDEVGGFVEEAAERGWGWVVGCDSGGWWWRGGHAGLLQDEFFLFACWEEVGEPFACPAVRK